MLHVSLSLLWRESDIHEQLELQAGIWACGWSWEFIIKALHIHLICFFLSVRSERLMGRQWPAALSKILIRHLRSTWTQHRKIRHRYTCSSQPLAYSTSTLTLFLSRALLWVSLFISGVSLTKLPLTSDHLMEFCVNFCCNQWGWLHKHSMQQSMCPIRFTNTLLLQFHLKVF